MRKDLNSYVCGAEEPIQSDLHNTNILPLMEFGVLLPSSHYALILCTKHIRRPDISKFWAVRKNIPKIKEISV